VHRECNDAIDLAAVRSSQVQSHGPFDGLTASFAAFIRYRGKHYESEEAMTAAEFRAFDPSTLS
jgi:hypothetical protein